MENQNQPNERPMIQNNYYGNIGQQINHVDKIEAHFDKDMGITVDGQDIMPQTASSPDEDEEGATQGEDCSLPPELDTEKARAVLQGLQRIGVLGDGFQPQGLSWSECGYLAQQMAYKLGIDHQWVVFGKLWHLDGNSLRSGYNRSKDQRKMSAFDEKIKEIIR